MGRPQAIRVLLCGPSREAGGGVLAVCDALEAGLKTHNIEVERVFVGAGTGDFLNAHGAWRGVLALVSGLPSVWRGAARANLVHLNPSFSGKSLLRELIFAALTRLQGRVVVTHFHGGLPSEVGVLARWCLRALLRFSRRVLVLNHNQATELLRVYGQKSHVISNGVPLPALDLEARVAARLHNPSLLFVGRFDTGKGHLDAIRVLASLRDQGHTWPLVMLGDGPEFVQAQTLAQTLGVQDLVRFCGYTTGQDKQAAYNDASLLLFPSHLSEGMPMTVLEAYGFGLPVVASVLPGHASVVTHENGAVTAPGDVAALTSGVFTLLLGPKKYTRASGENRRLAAELYNVTAMTTKVAALYQDALVCQPD